MRRAGAHGATDVTGFGLLGHGREMADASGVTLSIQASRVPLLPGALELARKKLLSGGAARNRSFLEERVALDRAIAPELAALLFDSETSGGLLIAVPEGSAGALLDDLRSHGQPEAAAIGRVLARGERAVVVGA